MYDGNEKPRVLQRVEIPLVSCFLGRRRAAERLWAFTQWNLARCWRKRKVMTHAAAKWRPFALFRSPVWWFKKCAETFITIPELELCPNPNARSLALCLPPADCSDTQLRLVHHAGIRPVCADVHTIQNRRYDSPKEARLLKPWIFTAVYTKTFILTKWHFLKIFYNDCLLKSKVLIKIRINY